MTFGTKKDLRQQPKMLESKSIATALSLIENDSSKVLNLTFKGQKISLGDYVPRGGMCAYYADILPS
jgi:hypothetical protein